ncbi:MAG: DUF4405 domain-containing protein [Sedimentisphaerales bacterium]|nr:DUF4405 domain-containing protein [Sedimentisphaerales bacterium]
MKRNTWNFIVDVITLFAFVGLVWTGFLIHYVLPPRHGRLFGTELLLWGWDRHNYGQVHFYLAIGMTGLSAVHVWLHWSWVCGTIGSLFGRTKAGYSRRVIYGLIFLLIVSGAMVGSLLWANTRVQKIVRESGGHGVFDQDSSIPNIDQKSLQEISRKNHVSINST